MVDGQLQRMILFQPREQGTGLLSELRKLRGVELLAGEEFLAQGG